MRADARIVITGFMAAGKTGVARALAARLGCAMIDLDEHVAARTGRTPRQIIEEDGEPRFRELETDALREVLEQNKARVVALGGGTWTAEENRALVAQHECLTVWLDAPFALCWRRIACEEGTRPLARDRQRAHALYDLRRPLYQLAGLRVEIGESDRSDDIAKAIVSRIERV